MAVNPRHNALVRTSNQGVARDEAPQIPCVARLKKSIGALSDCDTLFSTRKVKHESMKAGVIQR
jgi:hypothetical protein